MKPLSASSGDLLADRRADYAEMLFASGDHAAAAELMLGALELAPDWAMGWFRLGEFHEAAGATEAAAKAWRMAQELDPQDRPGASLKLALIGAGPQPPAPPSAFVETLFDQYAERFDAALVGSLDYRAPRLLSEAIRRARPGRFGLALDLGCGTGLMGEELRPLADRLEGVDLSAEMLRKARARNIYDRLEKADLQDWVRNGPPDDLLGRADLVAAADVFMYLSALDGVFAAVAGLLAPGGLFAFSVEKLDGEVFALRETRRYAHAEAYVRHALDGAGMRPVSLAADAIRQDRNQPVQGLIVAAAR